MMIANFTFLTLGAIGILMGIQLFNKHFKTAEWPRVDGKLLRKGVRPFRSKNNKQYYCLDAEYEYTVGGIRFTNKTIFELELAKKRKAFKKEQIANVLGLLSPSLQVHYNPQSPDQSFLYRSTLAAPIFSLSSGLLFVLIGAVKMVAEL